MCKYFENGDGLGDGVGDICQIMTDAKLRDEGVAMVPSDVGPRHHCAFAMYWRATQHISSHCCIT